MRVLVAGATGLIGRQLLPLLGAASHDTIALAFCGTRRFDDFQASLGMARSVLTAWLRKLTEQGILERHAYSKHPPRDEYNLTDMVLAGDVAHAMTPISGKEPARPSKTPSCSAPSWPPGDMLGACDRQRRPHTQMITRRPMGVSGRRDPAQHRAAAAAPLIIRPVPRPGPGLGSVSGTAAARQIGESNG